MLRALPQQSINNLLLGVDKRSFNQRFRLKLFLRLRQTTPTKINKTRINWIWIEEAEKTKRNDLKIDVDVAPICARKGVVYKCDSRCIIALEERKSVCNKVIYLLHFLERCSSPGYKLLRLLLQIKECSSIKSGRSRIKRSGVILAKYWRKSLTFILQLPTHYHNLRWIKGYSE